MHARGGVFDLTRNGRQVLSDVPDAQALRYLRRHMQAGDRVWRAEPDGYQVEVTATV